MNYRRLVFLATALAFVVIVAGAYVRLEDAGLGCPDWPGCYGQLLGVPDEAHDASRAWKEIFHRYLAATLGLLILALAIIAWRRRGAAGRPPGLATGLLVLVAFQAALGMWTVTMLLKPAIVTLHLLGGMTTLALLVWLALREMDLPLPPEVLSRRLRPWAAAALAVLVCQIGLGGWVSSNYAALACPDFPTCHGAWLPEMDFRHAFPAMRELGMTAAGTPLPNEALVAIHWTHRAGATASALLLGGLAIALLRTAGYTAHGVLLLVLLACQVALGIANVTARLPLALAVAHNAGAALLLVTLVVLNFTVFRRPAT